MSHWCTRLRAALSARGIDLIMFLTPTSDESRVALVGEKASGFVYVISLTGVTGARNEVAPELLPLLERLRASLDLPLVVKGRARPHITDALARDLDGNPIVVRDHCYGCTAGQGSSCGGALA